MYLGDIEKQFIIDRASASRREQELERRRLLREESWETRDPGRMPAPSMIRSKIAGVFTRKRLTQSSSAAS